MLIIIPLTAVAICFSIEPVNRMTQQTDENVTIDQPVVSNKIGRFVLTTRFAFSQMMRILLNQGKSIDDKLYQCLNAYFK